MTVSLHRTIVVLPRPSSVGKLLNLTKAILDSMTGNSWFPSPTPSLAKVAAARDALQAAEVSTLSKTRGTTAVRNQKKVELWSLLVRLKAFVQGVADDNPENAASIIESSGMSVKKPSVQAKPALVAKPGKVRGAAWLIVRAVAREASYEWQWSADGGETWNTAAVTLQAKTLIKGLPSATTCLFRFRAVTRRGRTDWSQPVACLLP
jgi:hypothetical protein